MRLRCHVWQGTSSARGQIARASCALPTARWCMCLSLVHVFVAAAVTVRVRCRRDPALGDRRWTTTSWSTSTGLSSFVRRGSTPKRVTSTFKWPLATRRGQLESRQVRSTLAEASAGVSLTHCVLVQRLCSWHSRPRCAKQDFRELQLGGARHERRVSAEVHHVHEAADDVLPKAIPVVAFEDAGLAASRT